MWGDGRIATRVRPAPPPVRQTHDDSCWAASLESWSRADRAFPDQRQAALIERFHDTPTGGIIPSFRMPMISSALGLNWAGIDGRDAASYLGIHLADSYVLCAYTVDGGFTHSVLIWAVHAEVGTVSLMDPNDGRQHWRLLSWFMKPSRNFILMWRDGSRGATGASGHARRSP